MDKDANDWIADGKISNINSNQKYLTTDLWKNAEAVFSPKAQQLLPRIPQLLKTHKPNLVLIHNGTNDLDSEDGETVAQTLLQIVQRMKRDLPEIKIVISEIPPRKTNKDDQVQICNDHLHTYFDQMEGVTMATHSNLRTVDWKFYEDDKHLAKKSIGKFAHNLKTALREALGIRFGDKSTAKNKKTTSVTPDKKTSVTTDMKGNLLQELTMKFIQEVMQAKSK